MHPRDAPAPDAKPGRGRPHHYRLIDVRHHTREPDRPRVLGGESGRYSSERYAALEAAPLGITVNTVAPGLTDTPAVRGDLTAEQIEAARRAIPIGRLGRPEDIAETIAFLASARAGYITGAVLEANGGRQPP